jgi:hypothetical protein
LTPTEVLIAIHDINPEKDRVALKKVTDACTACFEQRTVFTQQVLEKALNQMVEKVPLPLLFMRTVIQTIDAFPSLVLWFSTYCLLSILNFVKPWLALGHVLITWSIFLFDFHFRLILS